MACYWNYHIKRSDEMRFRSPDIPSSYTITSEPSPVPPKILNNREEHLKHLFTATELLRFQREGKMHILQNIPPSTLGYYKGECLVSINEPPMTKVELKAIAMRHPETANWGRACQPIKTRTTFPIAVGYTLVKEHHELEAGKGRPFSTYILPSHHCSLFNSMTPTPQNTFADDNNL